MYSNAYIFKYASIMVILVAAILSAAALLLQPAQERNVKIEKIQDILRSAHIPSTTANAEELYKEHIIREVVINEQGEELSVYSNGSFEKGDIRAFDVDVKAQLKVKKEYLAGKSDVKPVYPLFVCQKGSDTLYIIPLYGTGLWGPIWGNIALKDDLNTVEGATYGHKGETPGLGAEISTKEFEDQFIDKTIFNNNGEFVSIAVVKGGVDGSNVELTHGVDAISGGTITSNGVSDMIENSIGNYVEYFKKIKAI
ncbi:MAG: NADH:ubiquinone reductase (Na(+)-transporting) subunit C [Lentimicrobium sp.]|jgi:Na+-transporting NADH:ubiquinone oxidoreductase subunit C|nr:NADH:ubiquinone reductase (Na(+)-transporting) subunit C [Lentimicrobium sp.]MDD2527711.1 NADH:ubiquinone reductase (Na(+)-transporting) subunit C [Lentimicrobiaceae bacterium]MDD4597436.1 NADH:ubiquinone reductase (Na(+)-transporting) subunit C [Lentimicrobiaceae bacterium]MDY0026452.1 NADH:ubiquinone reductase (Na(+)-transporting) subunit C [Lentimicrobium sp.]HAH58063.1 NADH:ubiquinone reductase (Na(+)-transporting) subunit C [Bacteroidales bacterium]